MKRNYYDIESLDNVFTLCNYKSDEEHVDIYCLCDNMTELLDTTPINTFYNLLKQRIYDHNANFRGTIAWYDLHDADANYKLMSEFGLSDAQLINDPASESSYPTDFRIKCDTDPTYDEDNDPYIHSYNGYNYDSTMLALYGYDVYQASLQYTPQGVKTSVQFKPTTAKMMRQYNDDLFTEQFKKSMPSYLTQQYNYATRTYSNPDYQDPRYKIRKNMLLSGRHIDVAKLNEKQQKVALKRLLGMLGYQILESDKLAHNQTTVDNLDQLMDLIAYNISDCVNLKHLSNHKTYKNNFTLKQGLLKTYPELIYDKQDSNYKPDTNPHRVRRDRMNIDSSSAQLATKALCPYGHLKDKEFVSFMYPDEQKAKELGIKPLNILEESKKFFYSHFTQPEIRAEFDNIYNYYKSIEGKNFNASKNYIEDYGSQNHVYKLSDIPKPKLGMTYYYADGTPSSCYVIFSTGGVHGAEYYKEAYEADLLEYEQKANDMAYVQSVYPNPVDLKLAKTITMPNGDIRPYKDFLKSNSTNKKAFYKALPKKPTIFKIDEKTNTTKLNEKYSYTTASLVNHEDFESYYPNLLRMLYAFYNVGLGYDRYAEIFDNKSRYGKLMKQKDVYTAAERDNFNVLRNGTKLILNSASGAADASFDSNIIMNNNIISMRIIGQLFTWRIGQAQTLYGANVPSTNTDGLYTIMEETINNTLLAKEAKDIGVNIEPEKMFLISKDTNNRLEMDADTGKILSASGGTLGCYNGPNPEKSLAHPAIIDWALGEYLIVSALKTKPTLGLDKPFDAETGLNILKSADRFIGDKYDENGELNPDYRVKYLTYFQNIISSSKASITYPYGMRTDKSSDEPVILQHYNRIFLMKDNTPDTIHINVASGAKITPSTLAKRKKNDERTQQHDFFAVNILKANGVELTELGHDHEAKIVKYNKIDTDWSIYVQNKDLHYLTDEEWNFLYDNIDLNKYLSLLKDAYEDNWMNKPVTKLTTDVDADVDINAE